MPEFIGRINSQEVDLLFTELQRKSIDLMPALQEIEQEILAGIEDNFEAESSSAGPWPKLSPATVARRGKSDSMLQASGHLATSIQQGGQVTGNEVIVGTNVPYARPLQDGAKQNVTPKQRMWLGMNLGVWKKVGAEINLPARPFMEISDTVATEAENILAEHLLKGI